MYSRKSLGNALACLACVGLLAPATLFAAPADAHGIPSVADVALRPGGVLVGQVVNDQGHVLANEPVVVSQHGKPLVRTNTNATGQFAVTGLTGGSYEIASAGSIKAYRAWTSDAAPPAASDLVVVAASQIVRGQDGFLSSNAATLTALGLSVTALTLSIVLPIVLDDAS